MATYEQLAKAVEGEAPFLARCLRMAGNEDCIKLAVDVWATACGESCDLDKLLAAAGDPDNKEKLAAANKDILLWLERVSALQALEQRQARINMGAINVRDYDNLKALNLWAKMIVGSLVVLGFFVGLFFFSSTSRRLSIIHSLRFWSVRWSRPSPRSCNISSDQVPGAPKRRS